MNTLYSPPRLIRIDALLSMEIECDSEPRMIAEVIQCIQGRISPIGIVALYPLKYPKYRCVNGGFIIAALRALFGEGSDYRFNPRTREVVEGGEGFPLRLVFDRFALRAFDDTLSLAERNAFANFADQVRDYEIPIMEVHDKVCLLEVFNG